MSLGRLSCTPTGALSPQRRIYRNDDWLFEGWLGAKTPSSEVAPHFLGSLSATSDVAELSDITWAAMWAISTFGQGTWPRICLRCDCTSAAGIARPVFNSRAQPVLAKISEVLWTYVSQRARAEWVHVKGHSGEPFIDLVDACADAAIANGSACY